VHLLSPAWASAPKIDTLIEGIEYQPNDQTLLYGLPDASILEENGSLVLFQGNSLVGRFYWTPEKYLWEASIKYGVDYDLLLCLAQKESSFNSLAIGDNGLAKGLFQIHTDKHSINDECAFDIKCSADWTAQKIKEGKGYLWTTYKSCLIKRNQNR